MKTFPLKFKFQTQTIDTATAEAEKAHIQQREHV